MADEWGRGGLRYVSGKASYALRAFRLQVREELLSWTKHRKWIALTPSVVIC